MNKPPLPDKTAQLVKNLVKFINSTDKACKIKQQNNLIINPLNERRK